MSLLIQFEDRWDDPSIPWEEDHLQMAVAQALHRIEDERDDFTFAADMSGMAAKNKSVASRAKLMGMRKGETDLRLFFSGPRLLMIEMKRTDGVLSKEQKKRHPLLRSLGFDVRVVYADCPASAVTQVLAIVAEYIDEPSPLCQDSTSTEAGALRYVEMAVDGHTAVARRGRGAGRST